MRCDKATVKAILSFVLLAMSFGFMVPVANGHEKGPEIDITEALKIAEMHARPMLDASWKVIFVGKRYMKGRAHWLVYFSTLDNEDGMMVLDDSMGFFVDAQTAEVVGGYW